MTANEERAEAIRWIQAQMADYGLTMEALEAAGCVDPPHPRHHHHLRRSATATPRD